MFTTARDNQTRVEIDCCRGEAKKYSDNEPLGTLVLDKLPSKSRGDVKIEVSFRIDADGILHVRAVDPDSGARQEAPNTCRHQGAPATPRVSSKSSGSRPAKTNDHPARSASVT